MEATNWQDKYIDKLSSDMDSIKQDIRELRGMETRLMSHIDGRMSEDMREIRASISDSNRHIQTLMFAIVIGIGAIVAAVWLK